jgi:hypothetical protein
MTQEEYLAEAIEACRAAVDACPGTDPLRAMYLSNLGLILLHRFERTGDVTQLTEAIEACRAAVLASPADHPDRGTPLCNLGNALRVRSELTGDEADLAEAIQAHRTACQTAPDHHPRLAGYLADLGAAHYARFEQTGRPADLAKAIDAERAAVRASPAGHPGPADLLHMLSRALHARFGQTRDPADLAEMIAIAQAATDAAPAGHPNQVGYLATLGSGHWSRYLRDGDAHDREDAFRLWRAAAGISAGRALLRLNVALHWGRIAAEHEIAGEAETAFAVAIDLLPLEAWPAPGQHTRPDFLSGRTGLAGDAAASAINAGHLRHAVELLEQGRTVLWSQALHLRGDIDDLRGEQPDLAERLDALRAVLDSPGDIDGSGLLPPATGAAAPGPASVPASFTQRGEARIRAAAEWDRLITGIRALPRFTWFLRPAPLSHLTGNLTEGTVVIVNISRYRCDALAVSAAGVRLIPLPGLSLDGATDKEWRYRQAMALLGQPAPGLRDGPAAAAYRQQQRADSRQVIEHVLAWLWDTVTAPVLDALGYATAVPPGSLSRPRVWWCPTGPLTVLPLHAAGRRDPGQPGRCALDSVNSSYTPTLRALVQAGP